MMRWMSKASLSSWSLIGKRRRNGRLLSVSSALKRAKTLLMRLPNEDMLKGSAEMFMMDSRKWF